MRKFLVLIVVGLLLSGCAKADNMNGYQTASSSNIQTVDLAASDESHTVDGNLYLGDYIRYAETEYNEAMMDYAMFKVGGYPIYAKSYDAGESVSLFAGDGYEYTIENKEDPVYHWKWTDDTVRLEVLEAIENGKKIYTQLQTAEKELLEQHKEDVYADDWFRETVRTVRAELEYFPANTEGSWKVDLSEKQIEKIKDIMQRAKINPEADPYESDFRYTLSLYDSLGDYIFVVAMDGDRSSMYVEKGSCESEELKDMLNHIIQSMDESLTKNAN